MRGAFDHHPAVRIAFALLLLGPLWVSSSAGATRLALFPLVAAEGLEVSPVLVTAALRGELRRTAAVELQPEQDTRDHLEGARALGIACDLQEPACAAQLAALAGVERAVTARMHTDLGRLQLDLSLIDVKERVLIATSSMPLSPRDTVGDVRRAVEQLLAPASPPDSVEEPTGDGVATAAPPMMPAPSPMPYLLFSGGMSLATLGGGVLVAGLVVGGMTSGTGSAPLAPGESVVERRESIGLAQGATAALWISSLVMVTAGMGIAAAGFLAPPAM